MNRGIESAILALGFAGVIAHAVELSMDGDRITLSARDEDLRTVLERFSHAGVDVRLDPLATQRVTGTFVDEDAEYVLSKLLPPLGYAATWDVVRGPLGDWPRLSELHVFRVGEPRQLKPLVDPEAPLRVVRGPAGGPEFVADEILIAVKRGVSSADFKRLLAQIGGTIIGGNPSLGIYQIRLAPGANIPALVEQLRGNPLVDEVEPNYVARLPPRVGAGESSASGWRDVKAPSGAARVAVLDSGLMPLANFSDGVVGAYDALAPNRPVTDPDGHGTQMALIAAGAVAPDGTTAGSDGVPILAVRAFDQEGRTSNFALMNAVTYAIEQGARVINLSWGTETRSEFIADAVRYAQQKGLVVVAAAGNEPTGRLVYPAAYPGVVAVAALKADGTRWENSNYGEHITVAAPGVADMPVGRDGQPGWYAGTSIASAYVSSQIARYRSAHPEVSAAEVVQALLAAVQREGQRDAYVGFGKLDTAALERLMR